VVRQVHQGLVVLRVLQELAEVVAQVVLQGLVVVAVLREHLAQVELAVRQELAVVQVQVVLRAFLYHLHQVRGVPLSLLKVNMLQVQQRHIQ
jgi:hypothetical protein